MKNQWVHKNKQNLGQTKKEYNTEQKPEEEYTARKKIRDENLSTNIWLTNQRTIEVVLENKEIELDMDWDERIKQCRKEIEEEEAKRLQYKEIREQSCELNRLCRKYL